MTQILFFAIGLTLAGTILFASFLWGPMVTLWGFKIAPRPPWRELHFGVVDIGCLTLQLALLLGLATRVQQIETRDGSDAVVPLAVLGSLSVIACWVVAMRYLRRLRLQATTARIVFQMALFPCAAAGPVAIAWGIYMIFDLASYSVMGITSEATTWYLAATVATLGATMLSVARIGIRRLLTSSGPDAQ